MTNQSPSDSAAATFHLAAGNELQALGAPELVRQVGYLQRLLLDTDTGFWEWHPDGGCQRTTGDLWLRFGVAGGCALSGLWSGAELNLVHSYDRDKLLALRQRLQKQGGSIDTTFRAYDCNGQLVWLRFWGCMFTAANGGRFMAGGCTDYTDALSTHYLSFLPGRGPLQVLAGVSDGLWEWDLRSDEVVLDYSCWGILGYGEEQVDGDARTALTQWKSRMLPEDYPRAKQAFHDHVHEQLPLDVDFRLWHRDGGVVWVRCRGQVERNSHGQPVRALGVVQDITCSREALARAERQLEQLQQENAHRADLLFSLSHELRTPLNAILGYSQLVELDQSLNPDQRQRLGEIRRAGQHLLHLVGDVLELARIDSNRLAPSMEPIQPVPLVVDCQRLLEPLAETQRVSLIFESLGWEDAYICADPVRFKQVVLNLAGNAVKYNRDNGRVVMNFVPQAEGWLRLSILDTGSGIPEKQRDQVFEPFNRLGAEKGQVEGTGVGLAIAKRLTEAMGGRIDFDSHEGQGSIFWIEFPMIDAPPEILQMAAHPKTALDFPACRLLHADGRPSGTSGLRKMLNPFSQVQRLVASDAVEAIFVARTQNPDILLFDAGLPGMPAADMVQIIRGDSSTAKICLIAIGEFSGEGCDAVLPANYDLGLLCQTVEKCLAKQP